MSTGKDDGHQKASGPPSHLGAQLIHIQDWTNKAVELDNRSPTSRLTQECISIFTGILEKLSSLPKFGEKTYGQLKASCSLLILWDKAHGIQAGQLDDALSRSRSLRQSILEPLRNMGKGILRRLLPLVEQDYEESESYRTLMPIIFEAEAGMYEGYDTDSDSDESDICESSHDNLGDDPWCDIAEDMNIDAQCLLELAPLIECPVWDCSQESHRNSPPMGTFKLHAVYGDKIQNRFPKADARLVDRLALANWERFRETMTAREHNRATLKDGLKTQSSLRNESATVAPSELKSKFNDSGLGSSVQGVSVYAETIMSYIHDSGHTSTKIPPLPAEAKKGKSFECIACGIALKINNNSAWK
ncbi:unnamed protein product [Clonostachys byssicola]|uniref:Uncharacterized protein n=1 Tax=Clonostachys byssicola TaxID=160290 RepID=A0A9N9Y1S3_9HYPO|nr:unnamed protein product [Clonostachys byssicola]